MLRISNAFVVAICLIIVACSSKVTTSSTSTSPAGSGKYSEDISVWRPKTESKDTTKTTANASTTNTNRDKPSHYVEPKFAVNEKLDMVLDSISRINLSNGLVDGFTIQVYSGIKREEALNIRKQLSIALPGLDAEVQYVQPNFRVRAGKYYDRLQAQKDYTAIKKHFPNAIVIPERIAIH